MVYNGDTLRYTEVKIVEIGARIKAARMAKGMTQEELGEILGVQKSAIAKYENGRVVNIKRSQLKKISEVLNIPPMELIYDADHRAMQAHNDVLVDIIARLRTDDEFFSIVEKLNKMDAEKLRSLSLFL